MYETCWSTAQHQVKGGRWKAIMVHPMFPEREHDQRERWLVCTGEDFWWQYEDGQLLPALIQNYFNNYSWIVKEIKQ